MSGLEASSARYRALGLRLHQRPQSPRQTLAAAHVQEDGVEGNAEDVVLALIGGAVADPDGVRPGIAGELLTERLGEISASVDAVHDLQGAVFVAPEVGDELDASSASQPRLR